jgi:hypothetical protein
MLRSGCLTGPCAYRDKKVVRVRFRAPLHLLPLFSRHLV